MRMSNRRLLLLAIALFALGARPHGQLVYNTFTSAQPVTIQTQYALIPISATGAANAQVTLTIPAPAPTMYNYVCTIHFNASQNATSSANTNQVTTSTNFNSWALKY